MISGAGRTLTYDYDNRPTSITYNNQATVSVYDAFGNRTRKMVPSPTEDITTYIGQLYECNSGTGECTKYIFAGEQRIANIKGTETYYYHTDHLQSSNIVTDKNGNNVEDMFYYPYGELKTHTGSLNVKHKFTGHEYDAETGLYYMGARYYDPKLARFISADTIVPMPFFPQSLNRYSYAYNNPIVVRDLNGNCGFFGAVASFVSSVISFVAHAVAVVVGAVAAGARAAVGFAGRAVATGARAIANGADAVGRALGGALASVFGGSGGGGGPGKADVSQEVGLENEIADRNTKLDKGKTDIDKALDTLRNTEWAKKDEGKKILNALDIANKEGKIKIDILDDVTRARYDRTTGEITINKNTPKSELPGRLAHEGTHLFYNQQGKPYDFNNERAAFNNGYAVDRLMGIPDAFNPSDAWILKHYKGRFDK